MVRSEFIELHRATSHDPKLLRTLCEIKRTARSMRKRLASSDVARCNSMNSECTITLLHITEKPKWVIWLIWAIVGHYTDKKTHFLSHFVRVLTHYGSNESNDSFGFFCVRDEPIWPPPHSVNTGSKRDLIPPLNFLAAITTGCILPISATRMARGGIRLVHFGQTKSTLITYFSGMKIDSKYAFLRVIFLNLSVMSFPKFVYMTKNTPFFPILHVFVPLNDVRAYSAWSWKTTLITWFRGRAWYPLDIRVLPGLYRPSFNFAILKKPEIAFKLNKRFIWANCLRKKKATCFLSF